MEIDSQWLNRQIKQSEDKQAMVYVSMFVGRADLCNPTGRIGYSACLVLSASGATTGCEHDWIQTDRFYPACCGIVPEFIRVYQRSSAVNICERCFC
jgi:hypothetical protein